MEKRIFKKEPWVEPWYESEATFKDWLNGFEGASEDEIYRHKLFTGESIDKSIGSANKAKDDIDFLIEKGINFQNGRMLDVGGNSGYHLAYLRGGLGVDATYCEKDESWFRNMYYVWPEIDGVNHFCDVREMPVPKQKYKTIMQLRYHIAPNNTPTVMKAAADMLDGNGIYLPHFIDWFYLKEDSLERQTLDRLFEKVEFSPAQETTYPVNRWNPVSRGLKSSNTNSQFCVASGPRRNVDIDDLIEEGKKQRAEIKEKDWFLEC